MIVKEPSGKIFLNEQRGLIETDVYKRTCTFNFGSFFNKDKEAFGPLYVMNDEVLAGSAELQMPVSEDSWLILIPVTGNLRFKGHKGISVDIETGQAFIRDLPAGRSFSVTNPYEVENINFLQILIKRDKNRLAEEIFDFNLESEENTLISLTPPGTELPFSMSIGRFGGRKEAVYTMAAENFSCFAFVVAGAFEVEGRLLHPNDSLALWDINSMELEALSNHALILILGFDSQAIL